MTKHPRVACTECKHLQQPDYCASWKRRTGLPLDQRVRICTRYEEKNVSEQQASA